METKDTPKPPPMSPYVFTLLLAFFGIWCFYDGWLSTDPEMQKHALFNRVLSFILLPWSIYDFMKLRKTSQIKKNEDDSELK